MRSPASCSPRQRGFTLVELVVAMAVLVILLAIAAPGFRDFTRSQRIKTASAELASAMSYARSEAIKRRANVEVAALGAGFAEGWEVRVVNPPEVLRAQAPLTDVSFGVLPAGPGVFTYGLDGRTSATDTSTALLYSGASTTRHCVSVDPTGMPRTRRTTTTATTC